MGNISREMEILSKNQKEILEIKKKENTGTERKNAFDGLISRLDTAEERTCDLGDVSIESSETKK